MSSRDETRPGMKSSLSMAKCLLLFTRFCRDEISSRDKKKRKKRNLTKFTRCRPQAFKRSHFMHLAFNRLMFLTYQASDFNNWEKRKILLYAFIILDGRFSFKLNFIPGRNSHVNRIFFLPRGYFISVTCKRTRSVSDIFYIKMALHPVNMGAISHIAVLHRS